MLRTGHRASGDTPGFAAVRAVQDSLPPPAVMAYTGADTFPERGLMEDDLHWAQGGLNEAGEAAAVVAAAWVPPDSMANRAPGELAVTVAPNPVSPDASATVAVTGTGGAPLRVEVRDLLGHPVAVVHDGPSPARRLLSLRLPQLAEGRYLVWVDAGGRTSGAILFVGE